ncbi:MAG: NAD(P)H-binding protein [Gammaproteobacteria bacterium]|nr:NAD(P)H-binding protein [Gammaproteobacteria bacterium]
MLHRPSRARAALARLALVAATTLLPALAGAAEVIVFGGTGKLGSEVVRALNAAGHEVTVFHREGSDRSRLQGLKYREAIGDATRAADVQAALAARRYDVVVDALAKGRSEPAEFYVVTQRAIVAAAKASGVKQVILHGSVGAGASRAIYPESRWSAMKDVLQAKDVAERALVASGVPYTIIRNAVLRDGAPGAREQAALTEDQMKFGGVTRAGLGRLTAECTLKPECLGRIFHAIDPQVPLPVR